MTKIEWTEATWNPIVGCSIVSPGCTNCYAMKMAARLEAMVSSERSAAITMSYAGELEGSGRPAAPQHYLGTTKPSKAGPVWTGHLAMAPDRTLTEPLRRRKPTTYFVNSMGDLFHEDCPDEWIDRVFAVMALSSRHTFQVLTKRAARMRAYCSDKRRRSALIAHCPHGWALTYDNKLLFDWPLPNVWLGVSAERQTEADARIPDLLGTPAAVRFVSAEPLLGPIDFTAIGGTACLASQGGCCGGTTKVDVLRGIQFCERAGAYAFPGKVGMPKGLDWIIVGGESGPVARPMHPDWARAIRDQCTAAGVPFFFKQWGEWAPTGLLPQLVPIGAGDVIALKPDGSQAHGPQYLGGTSLKRIGKKQAGRLLDGREWNETPAQRQPAEVA